MTAPAICILFAVIIMVISVVCQKQTYIVHMDVLQKPEYHRTYEEWYSDHLQTLLSVDPTTHILYTYTTALYGFAAVFEPHHIQLLRTHPSVLHLHPDPLLHLHTTRSPHFLGLFQKTVLTHGVYLTGTSNHAADVIVGVLDTGVWPESKSFDDSSFTTPPPSRWKGECESGVDFESSLCNKKIIGARSFSRGFHASSLADHFSDEANRSEYKHNPKEFESARDHDGHGTHTASTSVGSPVANASLLGYAPGTARGMETGARLAAYKVCWVSGCSGSDILAGIDKAISDGVDILSLSLGGGAVPYYYDTIAIGAFAAMQRGIFVACSAGNSGPKMGTLANTAPWITTVGAGTLDRNFPAYATLGNGVKYTGASLYSGRGMGNKMVPLIYLGKTRTTLPISLAASNSRNSSNLCLPGTLDPTRVKGAVVFCDRGINARVEKGAVVKAAGGVGMILANMATNGKELVADSHLLPALSVSAKLGDAIREYAQSDHNPRVILAFGGTVLNVHPSPVVASFSSRGPNSVTPEILKPDVIGPGVNILAGWSGSIGPTGLTFDKRKTDFNILSG